MRATEYVLTHRELPPAPGLVVLRADFGAAPAPAPVPQPELEAILREMQAVNAELRRLVQVAQAHRPPWDAPYEQYRSGMAQIMDHDIGPIVDWANQQDRLIEQLRQSSQPAPPPAPQPPPPPTTPPIRGTAGSYGVQHDPAVDAYLGLDDEQVQWGPHHGISLIAPVDCTIEMYSLPTPLTQYQQMTAAERENARALFYQHACSVPALQTMKWVCNDNEYDPAQTMFVAVLRPNRPITLRDGTVLNHMHFGHVHAAIRTGPCPAGTPFAQTWDSGIRFELAGNPTARAAHVHVAASTVETLSPNGNVSGLYACEAMGWYVTQVAYAPGPNDYMQPNKWCAGRRYSEFQQAGKAIPPMPS